MSNQDLTTGLQSSEKQRYVEIDTGVYAEQIAITDAQLDSSDGSIGTIEHEHRQLHAGRMYTVYANAAHGSELANDAEINILLTTGAKEAHVLWNASCGGVTELYISLAPTTSGGVAFTPVNHMIGGDASTVTAKTGVTVNDAGTELDYWLIPGGSGGRAVGAGDRGNTEFEVPANTTILIRMFNRAGTAQLAKVGASFYEEE